MAKGSSPLEQEAAQSTTALGPLVGLAREDFVGAVALLLRETATDPARTMRHVQSFGDDVVKILTGKSDLAPDPKDHRFADSAWKTNLVYRRLLQAYVATQKELNEYIDGSDLDAREKGQARFFASLVTDALAPSNWLFGNPAAVRKILDTVPVP